MNFNLRLLDYIAIFGICVLFTSCSDSNFASKTGSKGDKSDSPESTTENITDDEPFAGELEFDEDSEDGLGDSGREALDDFIESGDKIRTGKSGSVLERFAVTETKAKVDVAIIIDTSGSMGQEITLVENNLAKFLLDLAKNKKTKNLQLFVLAGESSKKMNAPPAVAENENFSFSNTGHKVKSHNSLAIAKSFIEGQIVVGDLKLREDSSKHLIFISDDQASTSDSGIDEAGFRTYLNDSLAETAVTIHGIVCQNKGGQCANRGDAYINLAQDDKYKGTVQELTTPDWTPLFEKLADSIKSKLKLRFGLSQKIGADEKLRVYVEGKEIDGKKYEVDDNFVVLDEDVIDAEDEVVFLYYKDE